MDPEAPGRIAWAATDALGAVEILVNNAGGSRPFGKDASEEQWEEALTLNFTRHRQLTGQLLGGMEERGWGRIVNITGKSEPEGVNGAFAAKAALHSWAKGLSREVGKRGITVNSIPPGRIMSEQIERNYSPEYRAQQSAEEIPVGEYGQPGRHRRPRVLPRLAPAPATSPARSSRSTAGCGATSSEALSLLHGSLTSGGGLHGPRASGRHCRRLREARDERRE